MVKFEVKTEDGLWRICDILDQMVCEYIAVGMAVLVHGIKEDERLAIIYLVRCECTQPTEFDRGRLNAHIVAKSIFNFGAE